MILFLGWLEVTGIEEPSSNPPSIRPKWTVRIQLQACPAEFLFEWPWLLAIHKNPFPERHLEKLQEKDVEPSTCLRQQKCLCTIIPVEERNRNPKSLQKHLLRKYPRYTPGIPQKTSPFDFTTEIGSGSKQV